MMIIMCLRFHRLAYWTQLPYIIDTTNNQWNPFTWELIKILSIILDVKWRIIILKRAVKCHTTTAICEMRNSDKGCCSECFWPFVHIKLLCAEQTTEHIYKWFKFVNTSYGMDADIDSYVGNGVTQGYALYDLHCSFFLHLCRANTNSSDFHLLHFRLNLN